MIVAYKHLDGSPKINTATSIAATEAKTWCVKGTAKELDRLPVRGEEILDPATLTIVPYIRPYLEIRQTRYTQEADPLKPEAEAELKQGRPQKYFEYIAKRNQVRRETEPEETKLALVKKDQIAYWKVVCDNMILTKYSAEDRDGYTIRFMLASSQGLTNRANYLLQLFLWGAQLNTMYDSIRTKIENAATVEEVTGHSVDFTVWESQDPKIKASVSDSIKD